MIPMLRRAMIVAAVVALGAAGVAQAGGRDDRGHRDRCDRSQARTFYATTSSNLLVKFDECDPSRLRSVKALTGFATTGATLRGIDFRPATGDLYGVGSDNIVYRVNPQTGIVISEGPAFTPALGGTEAGFDFNPTVDKIRVTTDADENRRLDPDPGSTILVDGNLNPAGQQIVGSAYTNSSFTASKPLTTTLYALSRTNQLFVQNPPNNGTLTMPVSLRGVRVGTAAGFDIAGDDNQGWIATRAPGARASELYRVDVTTGRARSVGRIGKSLNITGLAAWQDQV
jgi:uncharacterized protein DUF4394